MSRHVILAVAVLALSGLACMEQVVTPTPAATITPSVLPSPPRTATPSATAQTAEAGPQTAQIVPAVVKVHETAAMDSKVIGWLEAGQVVAVYECTDIVCEVSTDSIRGFVYIGCLNVGSDRKCEAAE